MTMMKKIKFKVNLMKKRIINKIIQKKPNIQRKTKVKIKHHKMYLTMKTTIPKMKRFMRIIKTLRMMMKSLNGMIRTSKKTTMIFNQIWILRKTIRVNIVNHYIMIAVLQAAKDLWEIIKSAEKIIASDNKLIT